MHILLLPRFALALICLMMLGAAVPAAADEAPATPALDPSRMELVFNTFFSVDLDLEHPLQVQDFHLTKDALQMIFQRGTFYLARPVAGEVTGAYFLGDGVVQMKPPSVMERKALKYEYGQETVNEPFSEVVLRFDDGTDRLLRSAAGPGSPAPGDPSKSWASRGRVRYNSDDLQMDFLEARLSGLKGRDFFVADLNTPKHGWLNFNYNDRQRIEVSLYREKPIAAGKRAFDSWCLFHKQEEYDGKGNYTLMPEADVKDPAALRHVEMTVEIPNTKTVQIATKLTIESRVDGLRVVRMNLLNNIDAASWEEKGRPITVTLVGDENGGPLPYIHKWHQLLIALPKPLARGERAVIRVDATEDTIIELTPSSYYIYSTYPWFPRMGDRGGRYTIDWTVKVVKPMLAAGSGDMVREWTEGKMNCGQWRSEFPVMFPSFIFGEFDEVEDVYRREPPATGEVKLRLYAIAKGAVAIRGKPENIFFNVKQGLQHYETIFGPFPFNELDITQMAQGMGFSQSPPGVLFISGGALKGGGGGGRTDQHIFHELAHQWWGTKVGWVGPEDDWISESMAEYASGLLTEGIDPAQFRLQLKEWRQEATAADGKGSIAAAYHSDMRTALIYAKGPCVIHMLRTWMGWEKFIKLTSTIQEKYTGRSINTDTIAREASAIMGYDMFSFFDEWIRDQGIPKVHYSWSTTESPDGKFIVTLRLRQEDVGNFKILMVPISFDFGAKEAVVIQKPILKADTEIQVKVPARPRAVRIDDDLTQLADFIQDGKR